MMAAIRSRRIPFGTRLMVTLLITMGVVGAVQYVATERALSRRAQAQLAAGHQADAKVIRSLYEEEATGQDPLSGVRELLNHVATRPGVLRVALIGPDGVVAAVGQPGHGGHAKDAAPAPANSAHPMPSAAMPNHAMSNQAQTDHAMPDRAQTDHAMPDRAQPDHAMPDRAMAQEPTHKSAPVVDGTEPGRVTGGKIDSAAAATVRQVTSTQSPHTEVSRASTEVTVTVAVALGTTVHALEVVRSTTELRQQISDLRLALLGALALGLPFGLITFHLLGGRALSNRLERAIEDSATDALTGLRNHRRFHEELHQRIELARRHGRPLTLALIDLDGFKQVNDSLGHRAGDRVLASVGLVLRQGRPEDLPFRVGGDEFALLLPEVDLDGGHTVVSRIRETVESDIEGVTTSIGLASFDVHAPDAESLLQAADVALYQAKRDGRNRIVRTDGNRKLEAVVEPAGQPT